MAPLLETPIDQRVAGRCPLCRRGQAPVIEVLNTDELVALWHKHFAIDIREDVGVVRRVARRACPLCELEFCDPPVTACGRVYAALRTRDWYYQEDKWEYDMAIRDIPAGAKVAEVGCGDGHFVARLSAERNCDVTGLELNPDAVSSARARGRPVVLESVSDRALREAGRYDIVSAFQVLEHVPDPFDFIGNCCRLLKPGGLLILSVPNNRSFLRYAETPILNLPPHHVTRWSRGVFDHLSASFPVCVERVKYEPLAADHLNWYANVQLARLPWITGITGPFVSVMRTVAVPLARRTGMYRLLRGHSVYVRLKRC